MNTMQSLIGSLSLRFHSAKLQIFVVLVGHILYIPLGSKGLTHQYEEFKLNKIFLPSCMYNFDKSNKSESISEQIKATNYFEK